MFGLNLRGLCTFYSIIVDAEGSLIGKFQVQSALIPSVCRLGERGAGSEAVNSSD